MNKEIMIHKQSINKSPDIMGPSVQVTMYLHI